MNQDDEPTLKEWCFIIGFVIALALIFFNIVGCTTSKDRALRVCKYFGGLQSIQDDQLVMCKDGTEWMLWE